MCCVLRSPFSAISGVKCDAGTRSLMLLLGKPPTACVGFQPIQDVSRSVQLRRVYEAVQLR